MDRKTRKKFLEILDNEVKKHGVSRCCYLITRRLLKTHIKYLAKRIHPWDYSKQYPYAANLFTHLCYPRKNREHLWGKNIQELTQDIESQQPSVGDKTDMIINYLELLKERPGEWSKRFKGVSKYSNSGEDVLDKIFTILETGNFSESEIRTMKKKVMDLKGIEHKESIEMMLDTLLLMATNKKEAN